MIPRSLLTRFSAVHPARSLFGDLRKAGDPLRSDSDNAGTETVRPVLAGFAMRRHHGGSDHVNPVHGISSGAAGGARDRPLLRGHGSRGALGRFRVPAFGPFDRKTS